MSLFRISPLFTAGDLYFLIVTSCNVFYLATCDCKNVQDKTTQSTQLFGLVLQATKLSDSVFIHKLICAIQCMDKDGCLYFTINQTNKTCSLFAVGPTVYDVSLVQTYALTLRYFKVILHVGDLHEHA